MNKIKRSGRLLKASFAVLFREKKLLLFPLIGTGLAVIVALFFFAPIALYPTGHPYTSSAHWSALADKVAHFLPMSKSHEKYGEVAAGLHPYSAMISSGTWWVAPLFALAYFTSMFLATFCNVAFYHEIMQALNGNAVSIRRGFRFATARWRSVLLWSLFAGLVGYLINAIEQRVGFLGRIITGFFGFAWSVACIFIIPTLVRENETVNPLKHLRTSAGTLKRTWGELVIGFVGLELASGLLLLAALLAGAAVTLCFCWCFHLTMWLAVPVMMGELMLLLLLLGLIGSIANPVYRCALYVYATEGVVPESFDKELLNSAWKVK